MPATRRSDHLQYPARHMSKAARVLAALKRDGWTETSPRRGDDLLELSPTSLQPRQGGVAITNAEAAPVIAPMAMMVLITVVVAPVVAVIAVTIVTKCEDFRDPHMIPLSLSQKIHFLGRLNRKFYLIGREADAVSHTTHSYPSQQDLLRYGGCLFMRVRAASRHRARC